MSKRILEPNTTLYPAPIVLITTGGQRPNVMTYNRIVSCFAEPPRLAISIRPGRYSHSQIHESGEFIVNIPMPEQSPLADYIGVVTGQKEDKIAVAGLKLAPVLKMKTPLLTDCPVNIECVVEREIALDSHTMFIGLVQAVHVEESLLNEHWDVHVVHAQGIIYDNGTVREKPTYKFRVDDLRGTVQSHGVTSFSRKRVRC